MLEHLKNKHYTKKELLQIRDAVNSNLWFKNQDDFIECPVECPYLKVGTYGSLKDYKDVLFCNKYDIFNEGYMIHKCQEPNSIQFIMEVNNV